MAVHDKILLCYIEVSALYCDHGGFLAGVLWHPQNAAKPAGWHARAAYFGRNAACPCAKAVPPPWQRRHACVSAVHLLTVRPWILHCCCLLYGVLADCQNQEPCRGRTSSEILPYLPYHPCRVACQVNSMNMDSMGTAMAVRRCPMGHLRKGSEGGTRCGV